MNETTNNQKFSFLDKTIELRGAYSSSLLKPELARKQYLGRAKNVWSDNQQLNGIDKVMEATIYHYLLPERIQEVRSMFSTLTEYNYGFKKDVEQLKGAVRKYKAPHVRSSIYRPSYRETLEEVRKLLQPKHIFTVMTFDSLDAFKEFLSNKKASSGVFACYTTAKKKGQLTKEIFAMMDELEQRAVVRGTMNEPTIPGVRLQLSIPLNDDGSIKLRSNSNGSIELEFKQKTRLINMVSLLRIYSEMKFSIKVQMYFGSFDWYAGGKTPQQIGQYLNSCRRQFSHWESFDYSSYDQTLPGWFIKDAFDIIKGWFRMSDYESNLFDMVVGDFIHKGIVSDGDGNITHVHDGVESGSMFTQVIDTLCNYIMVVYYCHLKGKVMNKDCKCNICGDDNILFHNGWVDGVEYLNMIRKVFGVEGNSAKSKLGRLRSEHPEYLSRVWTWRGPYRNWRELVIKLAWHERKRDYGTNLQAGEVMPIQILVAFDECYHLGMIEAFDVRRMYRDYERASLDVMSEEAARAVGGIVAYETIYGHRR